MTDLKADLNQLVIFAKVVETRSFTAAGRALGLPKSTVSRKVAQLEGRLGVVLLERTTRKLSLTPVGAAFYERCARISMEIDEAERAVTCTPEDPRGLLRLAAPSELASGWLAEAIGGLLLTYPELEVELELSDRAVDLIEDGFDLYIGLGSSPDSRSVVRELGSIRRLLVASPGYLQRRGVPTRPEDLEQHDLVAFGRPRRDATFELRDGDGRTVTVAARPRLLVNSVATLRDAVLADVGVGLLPSSCCAEELDGGLLRAVLHEWAQSETVHAIYPTSRHLSTKLRCCLDYLAERLGPPTRIESSTTIGAELQANA
ncbi:MAG TPA: LysR family transcriptional regulator [Enhygromyxa sp.]|nr:LysR family transcriptional regulator [Enhygromyxa sp.]